MELMRVELTAKEMHDIVRAIYAEKEHYKQELREFEKCNQEISHQESVDTIKCRINDLERLMDKLLTVRATWLVKPMSDEVKLKNIDGIFLSNK